jgi:hypothetical protein
VMIAVLLTIHRKFQRILFYSLLPDDLSIRSGNINITAGQLHKVVTFVVHEDYVYDLENSLPNDIAIMEVKKKHFSLVAMDKKLGIILFLQGVASFHLWTKRAANHAPQPGRCARCGISGHCHRMGKHSGQ